MHYKSFDIDKKYNWKVKRKQFYILQGAGNSKTTIFKDSLKLMKLHIDWIIESDYGRGDTHGPAFWKYYDEQQKH